MFKNLKEKIKGSRATQIVLMSLALVAGSSAPSFAATPDPTDVLNGGGDGIFTTLQAYLTTHLVPLVFGLAVVSIAITLVLRWVRKAVHA